MQRRLLQNDGKKLLEECWLDIGRAFGVLKGRRFQFLDSRPILASSWT
jgi:hypothetical protein